MTHEIHLVRSTMTIKIDKRADGCWHYRITDQAGKIMHDTEQAGEAGSVRMTGAVSRANSHANRIEQDERAGVNGE